MLDLLADPQNTAIAIAYTFDLRLSPDETCTRLSITRKSLDALVRYIREQTVPTDSLQTLLNITDPQKRQISPGSKVSLALRDGIRQDGRMKSGFGVVSAVRSTLVELQGRGVLSSFIWGLDEWMVEEVANGEGHCQADPSGQEKLWNKKRERSENGSEDGVGEEVEEVFDDDREPPTPPRLRKRYAPGEICTKAARKK
ncbi:hypothetical protein D6D00_00764 [Aureobasidium pullulans]|nr:hypothetical protein D6D00_00764 [Aureobasidium pullulans]TIA25518.1 hypothetical protein D6C81_01633 [Aureobasidium pullulans]